MFSVTTSDLTLMGLFAALAISLNLVCGIGRNLVFSQAASYGVGAYTVAILATRTDAGFWLTILAAAGTGAAAGLVLGVPVLRTSGAYFAMLTWGVAAVAQGLANNLGITGGSAGLGPLNPPMVLGSPLILPASYAKLAWLLAVVSLVVVACVARSRTGWAMAMLGNDERAAQALGMSRVHVLVGFMVSSGLAAAAGGVFAYFIAVVYPGSFGVDFSTLLIIALLLGGLGSITGSLLGAVFVTYLQTVLQAYPNASDIVFGAVLLLVVHLRPQGLFSQAAEKRVLALLRGRRRRPVPVEVGATS